MRRRSFLSLVAGACLAPINWWRPKKCVVSMGIDVSRGVSQGVWSIYRWDQKEDGLWHPTKINEGPLKVADPIETQLQVIVAKPATATASNIVWRAL